LDHFIIQKRKKPRENDCLFIYIYYFVSQLDIFVW